jgi:hypothetical protein
MRIDGPEGLLSCSKVLTYASTRRMLEKARSLRLAYSVTECRYYRHTAPKTATSSRILNVRQQKAYRSNRENKTHIAHFAKTTKKKSVGRGSWSNLTKTLIFDLLHIKALVATTNKNRRNHLNQLAKCCHSICGTC